MSAKVKRQLESVTPLKATGASLDEARAAIAALQAVANDPEAASDLRGRAAQVYQELQARPADAPRREERMAQAVAVASKYAPSA